MSTTGKEFSQKLITNIGKVIIGKEETVRLLLTALVADGHVLLEDVPGTGKTKLAKSLARSLDAEFSRIQFTPDLLPSDIVGINMYDRQQNKFVFVKGPVFTNILLGDEINRATPRTQSGLLECMEERTVTVDGVTYTPGEPFFVIATENPVETAGTFPLPEAQLDRFLMKISMGLPSFEEELDIIDRYMVNEPLNDLTPVVSLEELAEVREQASRVYVHQAVRRYLVSIIEATRKLDGVVMGVSPRGTLSLLRACKAYACLDGRDYVTPDDIKAVAPSVIAHRIIVGYGQNSNQRDLVDRIISGITVPTEEFKR